MVQRVKTSKRSVNSSLGDDLVAQASDVTDDHSEVIAEEQAKCAEHHAAVKEAVANWNTFGERHGSFADEHSTL